MNVPLLWLLLVRRQRSITLTSVNPFFMLQMRCAKVEDAVLLIMGEGPATSTVAEDR
jgi:hypothetical protein